MKKVNLLMGDGGPVDVIFTLTRHHRNDYVQDDAIIAFMENDDILMKLVLSQ